VEISFYIEGEFKKHAGEVKVRMYCQRTQQATLRFNKIDYPSPLEI
jgi:hypothetical protein